MSRLLINEPPLQVLPSLAVKVGLNEAIVLQQIHYWSERSKVEIDGCTWVYNTIQQWREQFPFWSDDTISRSLKSLRASGLVIASRLSKDPFNKTLYYRIDYRNLQASDGADCTSSITATCGDRDAQNAGFSVKGTETTSETTNKEARRRAAPAAPSSVSSADLVADGLSQELADGFLQHRSALKAKLTPMAWKLIKTEAKEAGISPAKAAEEMIARGWRGLKADWLRDLRPASGQRGKLVQTEAERKAAQQRMIAEAKQMMGFAGAGGSGEVFEGEALERF